MKRPRINLKGLPEKAAVIGVGVGVAVVAEKAVQMITPPVMRPLETVVFTMGGIALESLAIDAACKQAKNDIRELSAFVNELTGAHYKKP